MADFLKYIAKYVGCFLILFWFGLSIYHTGKWSYFVVGEGGKGFLNNKVIGIALIVLAFFVLAEALYKYYKKNKGLS